MKVNNVSSTNGLNLRAGVKIKSADNRGHKYLYNEVSKITRDYKIPATFRNEEIDLPTVTVDIMKELNYLKIRFLSGKKH